MRLFLIRSEMRRLGDAELDDHLLDVGSFFWKVKLWPGRAIFPGFCCRNPSEFLELNEDSGCFVAIGAEHMEEQLL